MGTRPEARARARRPRRGRRASARSPSPCAARRRWSPHDNRRGGRKNWSVIATAAVTAAFACRPEPGLGSVALARRGALHVVDLATCRDRIVGPGGRGQVMFGRDGRARLIPFRGLWPVTTPDGALSAEVR